MLQAGYSSRLCPSELLTRLSLPAMELRAVVLDTISSPNVGGMAKFPLQGAKARPLEWDSSDRIG
jgi:hypothetical protein